MSDRLVTIATFDTNADASIAGLKLEAAGVRFFIADGTFAEMRPLLSPVVARVKIQVMEEDAELAVSLIEAHDAPQISEEEWRAGAPDEDFELELAATEQDEFVSPDDELVDRAYRAAILGLMLWPLQFYSLWLLRRVFRHGVALTAENRRRILITVLFDAWAIILVVILFWTALPR